MQLDVTQRWKTSIRLATQKRKTFVFTVRECAAVPAPTLHHPGNWHCTCSKVHPTLYTATSSAARCVITHTLGSSAGERTGAWSVELPAEEVPPELPEPCLGVNFARDGMARKDWLALVAVHSDAWLMAVAFFYAVKLDADGRYRLYNCKYYLQLTFSIRTKMTLQYCIWGRIDLHQCLCTKQQLSNMCASQRVHPAGYRWYTCISILVTIWPWNAWSSQLPAVI